MGQGLSHASPISPWTSAYSPVIQVRHNKNSKWSVTAGGFRFNGHFHCLFVNETNMTSPDSCLRCPFLEFSAWQPSLHSTWVGGLTASDLESFIQSPATFCLEAGSRNQTIHNRSKIVTDYLDSRGWGGHFPLLFMQHTQYEGTTWAQWGLNNCIC